MLRDLPPLLLPYPRSLRLTGGAVETVVDLRTAGRLIHGATRHPDGYELVITRERPHVRLGFHTEAGLRYGRATLAQLVRQYGEGGRLPCMVIEDAPAFAVRGVMLDVSRDKVPTMESLRGAIDLFAALKFNHLQLYTEHAFAYAGHEEVWRDASPITPEEARELSRYARERGIDLAANQNCFGHLKAWLELPRYAPLAETHGEWKFLQWPRKGPFSLCPTDPGSIELVRDLLGQLAPCFDSALVNVGCDETFDVGQGRSAAAVAERGRPAVYFDFVRQICDVARGLGTRPMLWADIALSHPEALGEWPGDAIGLAWGYEPDSPFADWCGRLGERGIETWVCPGTSSWRSITGRTTERRGNIRAAAEQGLAGGAKGYLVTDWGDHGHHQHWPIALNGLADAAQAAWRPREGGEIPGYSSADPRAVSLHVFNDETLSISPWLEELGDVDRFIREYGSTEAGGGPPIRNNSGLFLDLYRPEPYTQLVNASVGDWERAGERLCRVEESVPACPEGSGPLADELRHTLATARLAVEHAIGDRSGELGARRGRLAEMARAILAEHERLWVIRNRVGGLAKSAARYRELIDRLGGNGC
jgi:hexosaminidase